jgi:hypothetical protein
MKFVIGIMSLEGIPLFTFSTTSSDDNMVSEQAQEMGTTLQPPDSIVTEYIKISKFPEELPKFSDFVYRPVFYKLENRTFRKLDLFVSSGEGGDTYSVGSVRES